MSDQAKELSTFVKGLSKQANAFMISKPNDHPFSSLVKISKQQFLQARNYQLASNYPLAFCTRTIHRHKGCQLPQNKSKWEWCAKQADKAVGELEQLKEKFRLSIQAKHAPPQAAVADKHAAAASADSKPVPSEPVAGSTDSRKSSEPAKLSAEALLDSLEDDDDGVPQLAAPGSIPMALIAPVVNKWAAPTPMPPASSGARASDPQSSTAATGGSGPSAAGTVHIDWSKMSSGAGGGTGEATPGACAPPSGGSATGAAPVTGGESDWRSALAAASVRQAGEGRAGSGSSTVGDSAGLPSYASAVGGGVTGAGFSRGSASGIRGAPAQPAYAGPGSSIAYPGSGASHGGAGPQSGGALALPSYHKVATGSAMHDSAATTEAALSRISYGSLPEAPSAEQLTYDSSSSLTAAEVIRRAKLGAVEGVPAVVVPSTVPNPSNGVIGWRDAYPSGKGSPPWLDQGGVIRGLLGAPPRGRGEPALRRTHVPAGLVDAFVALADSNNRVPPRGIETCGVLCGGVSSKGDLVITHVLVPKQKGHPDSVEMLNEEDLFDYCIEHDLIQCGWIHTHPSQRCFMSSYDVRTHVGFQQLLPEAMAIVAAPCDPRMAYGVFRLIDPEGMSAVKARPDHRAVAVPDGVLLYETTPHVAVHRKGGAGGSRRSKGGQGAVMLPRHAMDYQLVDFR